MIFRIQQTLAKSRTGTAENANHLLSKNTLQKKGKMGSFYAG